MCLASDYITPSSQLSPENEPRPVSWLRSDTCRHVQGEAHCAFTDGLFNSGLGISIITTDERLAELETHAAFQTDHQPSSNAVPYEAAQIPGKGVGLVATRPIRAGEAVMVRTPAVMVDGRAFTDLAHDDLTEMLLLGIDALPSRHQSQYLNLSTHDEVDSHAERVFKIFATNSFRTRMGENGPDFHSTFTEGVYTFSQRFQSLAADTD